MAIEPKKVDISDKPLTEQEWAEQTPGTWMNLLSACRWDEVDNKYKMAPIKYSDVNLTGENIKFGNGQELTVVYACLASEYKNKKEVYNEWWSKTQEIVDAYKEQRKLEDHIASNNTSLKKLRNEGALLDEEDLTPNE